jgi:4-carboxymuconolactone decarboxylase
MPSENPSARALFGSIAPDLAKYTDDVLFGEVWKNPSLSPRDRSLITVASLVSLYRTNELSFHVRKAVENGVTRNELTALITHLAFYSGWPTAMSALGVMRSALDEKKS